MKPKILPETPLRLYHPLKVRPESRTVPLSGTGTHRGRVTMPLSVTAEPRFLPVGIQQEKDRKAAFVPD